MHYLIKKDYIISKIISLALFLSFNMGLSQDFKITELTLEDYLSDLATLENIIQKQHPNPYQFLSEKEQKKRKEENIKRLKKEPSFENFLKCVNRIGDGHLEYSSSKIKEEYRDYLKNTKNFFPFPVVLRDGRMFVNIKGGSLPYGTEIISIQKKSVKEILKILNQHIHGDGYIMSFTESVYSSFIMYYLNLIENNAHEFQIEYLSNATNIPKKITLKGIDIYEVNRRNKLSVQPVNVLELRGMIDSRYLKDKKIGVLTVNSFNLTEAYAYKHFSKFFRKIKKEKYRNIIIDIRDNGGGDPNIASLLFSFIRDKNFKNEFNYRVKTIKVEKENLLDNNENPAGDKFISEVENWLYQRFNEEKDGYYVGNDRLKQGTLENYPPDKDNYKGNVFLIIGGSTFSAAVYFAKLFKDYKRGKIIGTETGGNEDFTFAGWFLFYKLPKTKLVVRIPMTELYFGDLKKSRSKHGVLPDITIPTKKFIEYLRKEKDPEMQYLLDTYIK